ncbi:MULTISPECIES: hypothetical protein [unclassified Haematospirillum]|uniref:hypothetical protein n=1 Tax=unclassified Haematospirillum TaxID=2622088 RepID=UPI00143ADBC8|nr:MULTISPECIES: hypothetical protein [unclassified Haematospirillum]NKD55131.1 hypothetical protein [Haematospirillum sp. H4890]NKD75384.1 hypothetical protein [Haematospirillum sp. H4485]
MLLSDVVIVMIDQRVQHLGQLSGTELTTAGLDLLTERLGLLGQELVQLAGVIGVLEVTILVLGQGHVPTILLAKGAELLLTPPLLEPGGGTSRDHALVHEVLERLLVQIGVLHQGIAVRLVVLCCFLFGLLVDVRACQLHQLGLDLTQALGKLGDHAVALLLNGFSLRAVINVHGTSIGAKLGLCEVCDLNAVFHVVPFCCGHTSGTGSMGLLPERYASLGAGQEGQRLVGLTHPPVTLMVCITPSMRLPRWRSSEVSVLRCPGCPLAGHPECWLSGAMGTSLVVVTVFRSGGTLAC